MKAEAGSEILEESTEMISIDLSTDESMVKHLKTIKFQSLWDIAVKE